MEPRRGPPSDFEWRGRARTVWARLRCLPASARGQLGGLTLIGLHVPDTRRAEANAFGSMDGYLPARLLAVSAGYAIDSFDLPTGVVIFAVALAVSAVVFGAISFRCHG